MWSKKELLARQEIVVEWLKEKTSEANARGLVFGLSGGVDSAVVAGLCQKAFADSSVGVIMTAASDPADREDALLVARVLGIEVVEIDLSEPFSLLYSKIEGAFDTGSFSEKTHRMNQGNLKARMLMATLYAIASLRNYLVVGTDNAAEFYTGYFTKYGDGGVDLLPLASLTKSEVRAWARILGLPESIASKVPSAGLWQGQTDEQEMGVTYDLIDKYLLGEQIPAEAKEKIEKMHALSEHKRRMPARLELPRLEGLN